MALARSKGSNVNKAFDVGIIITSIRDNKSTIRVSNKYYRSTNEVNCTLYGSDGAGLPAVGGSPFRL